MEIHSNSFSVSQGGLPSVGTEVRAASGSTTVNAAGAPHKQLHIEPSLEMTTLKLSCTSMSQLQI